jgi:hypothetical protein
VCTESRRPSIVQLHGMEIQLARCAEERERKCGVSVGVTLLTSTAPSQAPTNHPMLHVSLDEANLNWPHSHTPALYPDHPSEA